ncbi:transposase IS116/IS110/IS902 family protein [Streptomyces sp. Ag109_O5-1]|uniref:IS110 family transposase n=1 Tax=Streptomyces sp. Ag109_O5-1 TaxID=1938851 RepID=UPI000F4DC2DA|nr:IS110 family transposase [Streptomyces sp. Ag109_O5-1]RPE27205.1 transposase IS116/IS110/IS902 family protein [Streptomyces sp. Ag109_O5-1]RPE37200.1 transposase IS116/IS110/IS902 family protein [Streptomyces sp. Ag109_O5-1]
MNEHDEIGVFLGLDVGKSAHHGHGLTPAGKKVFDKQLPNTEPKLRQVFDKLREKFGIVLVVVDQPASIGALPLTVARDTGCQVAYLPGLSMRRIADLYPGEAKTDARDAAVIADAARTMPHTLRSLELTGEITAELTVLVGFDQDLAAEATRTSNRIRGLLTQFHPSLERVLGPRLDHQAVTWLLERYGSPAALRKAGRRRLVEVVRPKAPRMAKRLIDGVFEALDEQTVVVPGTGTLDVVIPSLARSLGAVHEQRRAAEAQITALLEDHPLSKVLTSLPGVGVRTAAALLVTVGNGTSFPTAAHLASYAGLAPTTKSSAASIHGEHAPRGGNRQLKRAMFLSAFAALHDPASRTYYDRCRARGKTHTQALLRLARQRINVLFAMLRDGTFYEPRTPRLA